MVRWAQGGDTDGLGDLADGQMGIGKGQRWSGCPQSPSALLGWAQGAQSGSRAEALLFNPRWKSCPGRPGALSSALLRQCQGPGATLGPQGYQICAVPCLRLTLFPVSQTLPWLCDCC